MLDALVGDGGDPIDQVVAHDRLQRVQPAVDAEELHGVAVAQPVIAPQADLGGERVGVGDDDAAIAPDVERLERVQAERPGIAEAADRPAVDRRGESLARVLDDREPVTLGDRADRVHVGGIAPEVDGHDGARPSGDRRRQTRGIQGVLLVDVHEDRAGTGRHDGAQGRDERVRRHEHLVARAHARGLERQHQGVGAGVHPDRVTHAHELGDALLELGQGGPERVVAARDQAADVRDDRLDLGELAVEIREGDSHVSPDPRRTT